MLRSTDTTGCLEAFWYSLAAPHDVTLGLGHGFLCSEGFSAFFSGSGRAAALPEPEKRRSERAAKPPSHPHRAVEIMYDLGAVFGSIGERYVVQIRNYYDPDAGHGCYSSVALRNCGAVVGGSGR